MPRCYFEVSLAAAAFAAAALVAFFRFLSAAFWTLATSRLALAADLSRALSFFNFASRTGSGKSDFLGRGTQTSNMPSATKAAVNA